MPHDHQQTEHESLPLPEPKPDQPYVEVSALEAGMIKLPARLFVAGADPDEAHWAPSLAFYIRHASSGAHVVFDLGIRRDVGTLPPVARASIERSLPVAVPQSVEESLTKGGVAPEDVQTVVLSHLHWDHIGDAAPFPNATFILGAGSQPLLDAGYPHTPTSDILTAAVPPGARTRILSADDYSARVGPFPRCHDFFGDGSLFLVEALGHLAGHVNILARTSATGAWLFLGADCAHDRRLLTGEREMSYREDPKTGRARCAHADKDAAVAHIARVRSLLDVAGVQVLLAHDWEWFEKNKGGSAFLPGTIPALM